MNVEKIPHAASHGASSAKGGGAVKNDRNVLSSGDANDLNGAFGALLSSLGADGVEPPTAAGPVPDSVDDQLTIDMETLSVLAGAFTPTVQEPVALDKRASSATLDDSNVQNIQTLLGAALRLDGVGSIGVEGRSSGVLAAAKQQPSPIGLSNPTEIPDALGLSNSAAKAARLQKERVRSDSASPAVSVRAFSVAPGDLGKFEVQVAGDKANMLGGALGQFAAQLPPLEAGQQTELRRDKTIFKVNSTTSSGETGFLNSSDVRPMSLSLGSSAPDVGAGMTRSDQNTGSYWMSGDLKNAEIKLDGFGESPVEVSISMQGNQTHVAFRTDEMQTRLALEDAGATLKEMLSKEGLDLTGVSVGTSGSGSDGGPNHRSRSDSSRAHVDNKATKILLGTVGHTVTARAGKLDVFV